MQKQKKSSNVHLKQCIYCSRIYRSTSKYSQVCDKCKKKSGLGEHTHTEVKKNGDSYTR